ncbi:MAG: hypothetical protein M3P96_04990 [Actinomycetota bacterium]|nr:hypothetical protein [Actinomycetota bacterium]
MTQEPAASQPSGPETADQPGAELPDIDAAVTPDLPTLPGRQGLPESLEDPGLVPVDPGEKVTPGDVNPKAGTPEPTD